MDFNKAFLAYEDLEGVESRRKVKEMAPTYQWVEDAAMGEVAATRE